MRPYFELRTKKPVQKAGLLILLFFGAQSFAQTYPNPYRMVENWAKLPDGRTMGAVGKVSIDPDGEHIWAVIRCDATEPERFGNECLDSDLDPILSLIRRVRWWRASEAECLSGPMAWMWIRKVMYGSQSRCMKGVYRRAIKEDTRCLNSAPGVNY